MDIKQAARNKILGLAGDVSKINVLLDNLLNENDYLFTTSRIAHEIIDITTHIRVKCLDLAKIADENCLRYFQRISCKLTSEEI